VWCSLAAPDRVALPEEVHSGAVWVPALGRCTVEPLPGGWLLRPCDPADGDRPAGLVLDLTGPRPQVQVTGPAAAGVPG
jgi:hypothetical protein